MKCGAPGSKRGLRIPDSAFRIPHSGSRSPHRDGWLESWSYDRAMTLARQSLGKMGEELALRELERRGYAILARRYRTRYGEIDIVARDGETTVFVEVKARVSDEFGTAAEAVTRAKQRRLARMASDYVSRNNLAHQPCRFDVVAIDGVGGPLEVITVYPAAFDSCV